MAVSDSYTKERPNHWNNVPDASATPQTPFLSQQIIWNLYCYQNIDILIPLPPCCLNLVVSGGWDRKVVGKVDHQSFRIWQSNIYVWSQPPRSIIEVTCITMIIIEKSHVTPMKFNMEAEKKQDSFYHGIIWDSISVDFGGVTFLSVAFHLRPFWAPLHFHPCWFPRAWLRLSLSR